MAKKSKKQTVDPAIELRKLAGTDKIVIGTDLVLKQLKLGSISKVFVTVNCPDKIRESVERYADFSKAEVVKLKIPNEELGIVCKKPFSISVAGIKKE